MQRHNGAELMHAPARLGAKILAGVKLNRVTRVVEDGRAYYLKRRCWYAPALIAGAGALLAPHFSVLPERAWLAWEPGIYRLVYGCDVPLASAGQLRLPELPGAVLAEVLRAANSPLEAKLRALAAAVAALRSLHGLWVRFPGGGAGRFSHADATAHNVIYDPSYGAARWFDFETIHDQRRPQAWRHADDLRALAYSAAACLHEHELAAAARSIVSTYADRSVLLALRGMIGRSRHDMFRLAQADIGYQKGMLWEQALERALGMALGASGAR